MATVSRRPFAGQLVDFASPDDDGVVFSFKRCGVAENLARQNLSSKIRYKTSEDGDSYSERDFPIGDLRMETVKLALHSWNLSDDNDRPIPVNEANIKAYLSPREFDFCYEKALEVNPMWTTGGDSDSESD